MKTHFYSILLLCTIFVYSAFQVEAKNKKNPFLGEWTYEVSDAPEEYKTGTLIFSEKEGETVCVIKLEAGELPASNLKIDKDKISFVSYVEGNPVNVELTLENDKLLGTVDSPEGPKTISAVKKQ